MEPHTYDNCAALNLQNVQSDLILAEIERAAKIGIFSIELTTGLRTWSRGMHRIFETDCVSFVPSREAYARFYAPTDLARFDQILKDLVAGTLTEDAFELEATTAKGTRIWVHIISRAERIDGRLVRIYGTIQDITEQKRKEQALHELEEQYRLIYENSIEAILFTAPDGCVYSANPEACRILGRSEEEIRRLGRDGLIDQHDPRLAMALKERRKTGRFKGELNFLRADGTPFPVEMSTTIFKDSNGHERTSMFIRDITQKKRAEALLHQSNEDLRLLSNHLNTVRETERTTIAREVHDELGQIFTALKMELMAFLRSETGSEISPKAFSIMQMIESGIHSVQHISSSLRPRLLDDFGLIPAIEWQAEEFQTRTGIRVALDLPKEDLMISKELSTAIFRIIQESLTNILRHANATTISIDLRADAAHLTFSIRDNGRGISPKAVGDTNSLGLIGIRERLRMFGGSVEFKNHDSGGMAVVADVPLTAVPPL